MNWRSIAGLILLVVGLGALYSAFAASGKTAWMAGAGGVIWTAAGVLLTLRGMTYKKENQL